MVKSSGHTDKYLEYTSKIEGLDEEITLLETEIEILDVHLQMMEHRLRTLRGTLEKIFVDRFIDGMTIKKIARKYNYSESNVYEIIKKIKKIIF